MITHKNSNKNKLIMLTWQAPIDWTLFGRLDVADLSTIFTQQITLSMVFCRLDTLQSPGAQLNLILMILSGSLDLVITNRLEESLSLKGYGRPPLLRSPGKPQLRQSKLSPRTIEFNFPTLVTHNEQDIIFNFTRAYLY